MSWNIVLGPPGTGKTTFLLNKVEELFKEDIQPYELAYLAFTKKAATEALTRAVDKFDYEQDQLIYFRTIHSLCYVSYHDIYNIIFTNTTYYKLRPVHYILYTIHHML